MCVWACKVQKRTIITLRCLSRELQLSLCSSSWDGWVDFCFTTLQFPSSSRTSLESNEGKEERGLGVKLVTSVCFQGLFVKVEDKGRPKTWRTDKARKGCWKLGKEWKSNGSHDVMETMAGQKRSKRSFSAKSWSSVTSKQCFYREERRPSSPDWVELAGQESLPRTAVSCECGEANHWHNKAAQMPLPQQGAP